MPEQFGICIQHIKIIWNHSQCIQLTLYKKNWDCIICDKFSFKKRSKWFEIRIQWINFCHEFKFIYLEVNNFLVTVYEQQNVFEFYTFLKA